MFNIAIRADGGEKVGMGHVMRCLAVAEELKNCGCKVYFIGKYKQGLEKASDIGFETFDISKNNESLKYNNSYTENEDNRFTVSDSNINLKVTSGFNYGSAEELDEDLYNTRLVIEKHPCDLLLVDKYNLTTDYFIRLREFVDIVAFIDDLNIFECPADIIINGNVNAQQLGYKEKFGGQKLLLGTNFAPLRKEFSSIPKREINVFGNLYSTICFREAVDSIGKKSVTKDGLCPEIMITTGGSDPYNCTGRLLKILLKDKRTVGMRYNVVVGSGFKHKCEVEKIAEENSNIVLYINPKYMSEIICRSDLAISSGGSTLYELCCCGTPTIAFIMAENQKGIVNTLSDSGYIQRLGWYDKIENINIADIIAEIINDFSMRKMYTQKMQSLIDGKGALRIAQALVEIL